jgi:hypothetical protein
MNHLALAVATWMFSRLIPKGDRDSLIGDLVEEYAFRANAASSSVAFRWYLRQVCASVPPLLWLRLSRATWLATFGVALLAYVAVGVVQVILQWAMTGAAATLYSPLGPVVVFPMVVAIAYVAEGFRRRSAIVLGAMMLIAITAVTLWVPENAPLWYRIAYFVVGPAAAVIGSTLRSRRTVRS